MLKFLRRRARLTQRELGLAVGYTEGHISRLEQDQRPADVATLAARFVPALGLDRQPALAAQLLDLARRRAAPEGQPASAIPALPPYAVVRAEVLSELRDRLATAGRVAVCGLPGMGKTTVAAMLAGELDPGTPVCWITVTAGVNAAGDPLVRHLAGFLAGLGHAEGRRLLEPRDSPLPIDEQLGLLASALHRQPALVCVDNAHLLRPDPSATAILGHLVATTSTTMLLTTREDPGLPGIGLFRLAGMAHHEALALIAATDAGFAPELVERLIDRTGGSPMLLRLALGQPRTDRADATLLVERLEHEPAVTAYLLDTTLAGLSSAAWRALSLLAVFRQPVDLLDERLVELGQDADGPYDLASALDELQRRQLVDHPAAAALHPLVHDQVYARMVGDLPRRRRLHRVAGTWLEEVRGEHAEAAHHLCQAGEIVRAAALLTSYTGDLIRRGQALVAADLAESLLYRRRQSEGDGDALVHELLVVRGDLLANTVRAAESETAYREALAAAGPAARPRVSWRLARILSQRGQAAEAVRLCERAAVGLDPADDLVAAQLAVASSQALVPLSRYDDAVAEATRALDLVGRAVDPPASTLAEVRARAYATLGHAARVRRQFDTAVTHMREAADAAERADHPELVNRARYVLATVYFEQGNTDRAAALFTQVFDDCQRIGDGYGAARVLQALTQVHLNRGELATALKTIDRSRTIRSQLGNVQDIANADAVRAEVLLTLGRTEEARDLIEAVVTTSSTNALERGYHLAVLAQARMVAGDPAGAATALRSGLARQDTAGTAVHPLLRCYLAMAALITGDTTLANELIDPAGDWATPGRLSPGVQLDRYVLAIMRAMAGGDSAAAAHWVDAMRGYAETTGRARYRTVAATLATAIRAGTPLGDVPGMVWGARR